jgi:hypothetical protein
MSCVWVACVCVVVVVVLLSPKTRRGEIKKWPSKKLSLVIKKSKQQCQEARRASTTAIP